MRMPRTLTRLSLALASYLLFASTSPAQTDPIPLSELDLEGLMNVEVVTATKIKQKLLESPAIMTVITEQQIRDRGYRSVAEALRGVPGLSVWDDGLISSISIRGVNSVRGWSQTLKIMIDGQPVSFRTGSTYFIDEEMIPILAVERIEIIRGPASALYGANAFLGVVNVITRRLPDRSRAEIAIEGRSKLATNRDDLSGLGGELLSMTHGSRFDSMIAASYFDMDRSGLSLESPRPVSLGSASPSRYDKARPLSLFGRMQHGPLSVAASYQRFDRYGEFTDFSVLTHQNRLSVDNWFVRGDVELLRRPRAKVDAFVAYAEGEPTSDDHLDTGSPIFWIKRELGVQSLDAGADAFWDVSERTKLVAGADYTTDDQQLQNNILVFKDGSGQAYQNPNAILGKKRFDNLGGFAQVTTNALGEKLAVTIGGRVDDNNVYGSVFNPRLAGVYAISESTRLKLAFATSFKAPTPRELYDVSGTSRGNPDLDPQRAQTLEASVEYLTGSSSLRTSAFRSRLTDIIKLVPPTDPDVIAQGVQKVYDNVGTIDSWGITSELKSIRGPWDIYVNGSYQHSTDRDTGKSTTLVPEVTANAGVNWHHSSRLNLNAESHFVGDRISPKSATIHYDEPIDDYAGFQVDSNILTDLTLSGVVHRWGAAGETRYTLGLRNAFDEKYVEPGYENRGIDVPRPGRSAFLRFNHTF